MIIGPARRSRSIAPEIVETDHRQITGGERGSKKESEKYRGKDLRMERSTPAAPWLRPAF